MKDTDLVSFTVRGFRVVGRPFRWWRIVRWCAGVFLLAFIGLYCAARLGLLPDWGYDLVAVSIIGPPALVGVEPWQSELAFYQANCGAYRQP